MESGRDGRDLSVLLVEDDAALMAVMVECLLRAGYRVTTAADGGAALEAGRRAAFDAVVIDLFLPDAGGLGVARALAEQWREPSLPVLFTTALTLPAVREALAPAPVLYKPFHRGELLAAVEAAAEGPRVPLARVGPLGDAAAAAAEPRA